MQNTTPSTDRQLWAEHAYIGKSWQKNVLFGWDDQGRLTQATPGHPKEQVAAKQHARGPVIPGMPNLHSHAFQSAMAGLTEYRAKPSDSFWSWRELMYRYAGRITPEMMFHIAKWLYITQLKAGYTSVCEFHYLHHQPSGQPYDQLAELGLAIVEAAKEARIGLTLLPVLYQYANFGEQPPVSGQQRFINSPERILRLIDELAGHQPVNPMVTYGIAPHSLRATTAESINEALTGLARLVPDAPVHIHVAEQMGEVQACMEKFGVRPIQLLYDRLAVNERWCLVHATHALPEELDAIKQSGAVVGLCLTTEANLGDGVFPAVEFLTERNGTFGVGSDSNTSISWQAELRLLEYGQRLTYQQRNLLATPSEPMVADFLFDKAVKGGAQASGRQIGALQVGHQADFVVLNPEHPHILGIQPKYWLSELVFNELPDPSISDVFIGGQRIIKGRHHPEEIDAYQNYQKTLAQLLT